jgi:hypothetical protein
MAIKPAYSLPVLPQQFFFGSFYLSFTEEKAPLHVS